jgi:hypothetical protein
MRNHTLLALSLLAAGCSSSGASDTSSSGGSTAGTTSTSSTASSTGTTGSGSTGGTSGSTGTTGTQPADEVWADGKALSGAVNIPSGHVVEIAAGATVTCAAGTQITVAGTLRSSGSGAPAQLTGTSWGGIAVASGGTLALDGVNVLGADVGLDVQSGGQARYDHGTLHASVPFRVGTQASLSTAHATVVAGDASQLSGDFTASYLDYDKGIGEGFFLSNAQVTFFMEDSTLHGAGGQGDFIISDRSKLIHVAYSTISGAHCGFHFNHATRYEIDHVTDSTNVWGAMLYNAEPGPNSITNSNFDDGAYDLEQTQAGVTLTLDGNYTTAKDKLTSSAVTVTHPASAPVADAHPR